MEKKEFTEKVTDMFRNRLGDEYTISMKEVLKNNNVILNGLVVETKDKNIAPTIYMESFWDAFCSGISLDEIVDRIENAYRNAAPDRRIDIEFFKDFDSVRERICFKLINTGENEELLKDIPSIPYLDLSICFFYSYENAMIGEGSILIHNSHMQMWNVTAEQLMKAAMENTPRIYPWECTSMEDVINIYAEQHLGQEFGLNEGQYSVDVDIDDDLEQFLEKMKMQVLSNIKRTQGAACILYPEVLKTLADRCECSFYIMPSSIHEVILMAVTGKEDTDELKSMIHDINVTQVEPEEVLSDSLYYYDRIRQVVKVI
jgi:hypothetical protein